MKFKYIFLFVITVFLSGCGVDYFGGGVGTSKETTDEKGRKVVEMTVTTKTKSYDCDGKVYKLSAVKSDLTFSGKCEELIVTGTDNKIHVENVGKIKVEGVNNKITYGEGIDGKKPSIDNSGVNNTVEQK
jgi:hypothetical protein